MTQFESHKDEIKSIGGLVFVAAEKRAGMFHPEKFFRDHQVSFPFLLDEDRTVTKSYGVYHRLGVDAFNIAHPATFVVDQSGLARFAYVGIDQKDRAPLDAVLHVFRGRKGPVSGKFSAEQ